MIEPLAHGGRPRLPEHPDQRVNRRRAQYRKSKLRRNEQRRHDSGRCLRDDGRRCPIYEPEPEPMLTGPNPPRRPYGSRKPGRPKSPTAPPAGQPFNGRKVTLTSDGRRVWAKV